MAHSAGMGGKRHDKYDLYERCVQEPEGTAKMLDHEFKRIRGRRALRMREDFCGTAVLCAEWAKLSPKHYAMGVDLDPAPIAWGRKRHFAPDMKHSARVEVVRGNVLDPHGKNFDLVIGFNFSWMIFKERAQLGRYFARARQALAPDGIFELDLYGGKDAITESKARTRMSGVTYVWDQVRFDPTTSDTFCAIHFEKLRGGGEMKRAFTYDWRLWNLAETIDLLRENGLEILELQNETSDENDVGTGLYKPVKRIPNWDAWTIKILAERARTKKKGTR